jgi:hypothetical protein
MSLFICALCGSVDNTALTRYAVTVGLDRKPPKCSACDPEIRRWHDEFPRTLYDGSQEVLAHGRKVGDRFHVLGVSYVVRELHASGHTITKAEKFTASGPRRRRRDA